MTIRFHPKPEAKNLRQSHSPRLNGENTETQAGLDSLTQKGLAKKNLKKTNSQALPFQSGHELGIRDRGQHASAPIQSHTYQESRK